MTENIINIAVVVAGIDEEYQNNIICGINKYTRESKINTSYFATFGGVLSNSRYDAGEYNIYNLINISEFDGILLMTNTISAPNEKLKIIERVKESGIPAVVFDCGDYPEFYNVSIDNVKAMSDIVKHVIQKHNAKTINYISGPLANPEAFDRYNAFLSVMKENSLYVDNRRIYYGEFRSIDGKNAIDKFLSDGIELPDAFICANDAMALAAITELEKNGIHVPDDVIVTGFDNTYKARNFIPELTSVKRPLFEVGYKACEMIHKIISGDSVDKNVVLDASPVFSQSCKCKEKEMVEDFNLYKKTTYQKLDNCGVDISILNRLTTALVDTESIDEVMNSISNFISELECEKFYICLCVDWQGGVISSGDEVILNKPGYQISGYTKSMSAPLVWENGIKKQIEFFSSKKMFPEKFEQGGNISYFFPIHFRERCLGYCIFVNSEFPIKSMLCHSLLLNICNSIENIRKLHQLNGAISELDKLYVIDPLCNIYNRNGFIRATDKIFKQCIAENRKIMIMFIDMDGLKIINDNYGHKEGDFAIQRLAEVIRDCCMANNTCARFGGDEFLIFGYDMDEDDADELRARFITKLNEINKIVNKPYQIAASLGSYITEADEDTPMFKLITKADEVMYEEKKRKKTSRYIRH